MSRSTTTVVGAGIAGITAAFFELRKGRNVILIDSDSRAGGLLKSETSFNHDFDYGTHIYSETGVSELDEFLFSTCTLDNCCFYNTVPNGNFFRGELNQKSGYVDSSALASSDYHRGCVELLSAPTSFNAENLSDLLRMKFGETFYKLIFEGLVKKFFGVSAKSLAPYASELFEMQRVLAFDQETTKRLTLLDDYDAKLGLHRKGPSSSRKIYPKQGGTGWLVAELMRKLHRLGVEFRPSVKLEKINEIHGRVIELVTNHGIVKSERVIWTLPRTLLLRLIGEIPLIPPIIHRNTGLYDFVFQDPLNSDVFYINVFDHNLLSCRVTLYQNLTKAANYSCTVEVLADNNVDLTSKSDQIMGELIRMGLVDRKNTCLFQQFRSVRNGCPVLTIESLDGHRQLENYCKDYFQNVMFLGRSAHVFRMPDILLDLYNKVSSEKELVP